MNDSSRKSRKCSRREFVAISAALGPAVFGAADSLTRQASGSDSAGSYRALQNWPQNNCPNYQSRGIDIDDGGRIFVACNERHPVVMISARGKFLGDWGQGLLKGPHGLRFNRGTVWVTDVETHMAHQFERDGTLVRSFGERGVAGDAPNQFNRPTDFAFGPDGSIYISDGYKNTRVVCLAPDGTIRRIWGEKGDGPGQFDLVHAIAVDGRGNVFVADRNNRRVQIFDLNGTYVRQWNHVGTPYGLCACRDGHIFLCGIAPNSEKFRVMKLTDDGKVVTQFGDTGDGPGQFLMAHSLCVDKKGSVIVADGKANRVQKFVRG